MHGTWYLDLLDTSLRRIPRSVHIWLVGDFNLADIDQENERPLQQAYNMKQCEQLIVIMKDENLNQIVNKPTRVTEDTSSTLNLFLTNNNAY